MGLSKSKAKVVAVHVEKTSTAPTKELTPKELDFLKESTNKEESEILKIYKTFIEESPSGELTPVQFARLCSILFPDVSSIDDLSDHVFKAFDSDSNGFIDFREFLLAICVCGEGTLEVLYC